MGVHKGPWRQEDLHGHGEPPYDGSMEARIAKLESGMEYIQRDLGEIKIDMREVKRDARADFRITWGAIIAGFLGLAGLLAKGFGWY